MNNKMTDTGRIKAKDVRDQGLDKFYTKGGIVDKCLKTLNSHYDIDCFTKVIEPSAGNGSFLKKLPKNTRVGVDISPEYNEILKQDFLSYKPGKIEGKILTIGNPPFGKMCSLAVKFFNHSSDFSDVIAFIIPRTFRRTSVQNRLNLNYHLVCDEEIPTTPCSFEPHMSVKCCFQIWEKRDYQREKEKLAIIHNDWRFIPYVPKDDEGQPTPPRDADFAIRAYGGKCGEIITSNLNELRPKSWHFIKSNINIDQLKQNISKINFSNTKDTARQNSLGKGELVKLYSINNPCEN